MTGVGLGWVIGRPPQQPADFPFLMQPVFLSRMHHMTWPIEPCSERRTSSKIHPDRQFRWKKILFKANPLANCLRNRGPWTCMNSRTTIQIHPLATLERWRECIIQPSLSIFVVDYSMSYLSPWPSDPSVESSLKWCLDLDETNGSSRPISGSLWEANQQRRLTTCP